MLGMHRDRVGKDASSRVRSHERRRLFTQAFTAALTNGYLPGFLEGKVFNGPTKAVCVPWLNCYSCPGALASCPVGSLQTALGTRTRSIPYYVAGLLVLFGTVLGRLVCGLFCPFGFLQDLLHRIPTKKFELPRAIDRPLRWLKYLVAVVLVVALPLSVRGDAGQGTPFFCKFLCPAGTFGGALPILALNEQMRSLAGEAFWWKIAVLVVILVAAVLIKRPFCKYLCPLGAFYALFNRVSLYKMRVMESSCVSCHSCARVCPMGLDPEHEVDGPECIRCGNCKATCPTSAIVAGFELRAREALAAQEKAATEAQPSS